MSEMEDENKMELFLQVRPMKAKSQNHNLDFARKVRSRQPGSRPGSYRHRWKVERTFAWLGNFRRLVVRNDRSITIYEDVFQIACFIIFLQRVLN
jgi:transposase